VGYTNYPDNAVEEFCRVTAAAGIDVFRYKEILKSNELL
jgi:pyruvate carboxylase